MLLSDTHSVTVGPKGRVVVPAPIRRELGLDEGSELVAMVHDGAVVLMPRSVAKARLRALFRHVRGSLADELIAERAEVAHDEERP
jgi:AbrB family looped-hinge helix DNA binding protein